jgi:hypothetical protein
MITIAIPTFNRLNLVRKTASSFYNSNLSIPHNIRIYDDCSSEYQVDKLKFFFPTAVSITRNAFNIKADKNIYRMYRDFLLSNDEYLFNADSDLIFSKGWLSYAIGLLKETEGILTIFNANSHPVKKIVNSKFCIKEHVGSAGTFFTRSRVEEIIRMYPSEDSIHNFDWQWSAYFLERNIPIYCTNKSLVQHIGYEGQNSLTGFFDVGKEFEVDSLENGQIINDILEAYVNQRKDFFENNMENIIASTQYKKYIYANIKHRKGLGLRFILACFKRWILKDRIKRI